MTSQLIFNMSFQTFQNVLISMSLFQFSSEAKVRNWMTFWLTWIRQQRGTDQVRWKWSGIIKGWTSLGHSIPIRERPRQELYQTVRKRSKRLLLSLKKSGEPMDGALVEGTPAGLGITILAWRCRQIKARSAGNWLWRHICRWSSSRRQT